MPNHADFNGVRCVISTFLLTMYAIIYSVVAVFHIDMAQYTPGPNGESPSTGSAGMVKEAMFDLANEPTLYWLAFPAITLGAPGKRGKRAFLTQSVLDYVQRRIGQSTRLNCQPRKLTQSREQKALNQQKR